MKMSLHIVGTKEELQDILDSIGTRTTLEKATKSAKSASIPSFFGGAKKRIIGQDDGFGKAHKRWSRKENGFLRHSVGKMTVEEMSRRLGRTEKSVYERIGKLGLRKALRQKRNTNRRWTPEDIAFVKQHYTKMGRAWVAKQLRRSEGSVKLKAWHLRVPTREEMMRAPLVRLRRGRKVGTKVVHWTKEEEAKLRQLYGKMTSEEIAKTLGRTRKSVFNRARQLGLRSAIRGRPRKAASIQQSRWNEEVGPLRMEVLRHVAKNNTKLEYAHAHTAGIVNEDDWRMFVRYVMLHGREMARSMGLPGSFKAQKEGDNGWAIVYG